MIPETLLTQIKIDVLVAELQSVLSYPGDVAEFGVYSGGSAYIIAMFLAVNAPEKQIHLFDSFEGLPSKGSMDGEEYLTCKGWYQADQFNVVEAFSNLPQVKFHIGNYADFNNIESDLCFVHMDCDLFESTCDALRLAAPRLVLGGKIIFDDYNTTDWPGVRKAADRYLSPERFYKMQSTTTDQAIFTRL